MHRGPFRSGHEGSRLVSSTVSAAREGDPQSGAELMASLPLRSDRDDTFPVLAVPGLDPGISPGHPAFRPVALILRSSREAASRRRSSVLSGPSFETPLAAAPQDEGERHDRDHGP
jgi:hypothetical protein